MKYHLILAVAATALLFTGCQTKEDMAPAKSKTITLRAQKPDLVSKVTMTPDDPDIFYMGLSSEWEADDKILVFDAAGNATEFSIESIDDNGVATFTGTPETEIAEGDPITAVVLNEAVEAKSYNSESKSIPAYLVYQDGTLQNAVDNTLMYAEGTFSESGVSLVFEAKTSIVQFQLSIPSTSNVESVCKWYLSSGATGAKTLKNQTDIVVAGEGKGTVTNSIYKNSSGNTVDDISMSSANDVFTVDNHVVTVYFSVAPENFQNAIIQCQPTVNSEERYVWRVAGSSSLTIEGGQAYTVKRTSPKFALSGTHIKDDAAYSEVFNLPASCLNGVTIDKTVSSDWLDVTASESSICVTAAENTDGYPRQNTVTFNIYGYKYNYSYTQIEPKDFAGDWTLTMGSGGYHREAQTGGSFYKATEDSGTSTYGSSSSTGKKKDNYYDDAWTAPTTAITSTSLSLTYSANSDANQFLPIDITTGNYTTFKNSTLTNNITISGLYRNLTMGARAECNYGSSYSTLWMHFNTSTQVIDGGLFDGQNGAIVTELMNGGNYELGTAHGGNAWYKGSVSVSGNTTTVTFKEMQIDAPYYSSSAKWMIKGIMVTRLASTTNGGANLVRSPKSCWAYSNVNQGGAAYAAVYQGNIVLTKAGSALAPEAISAKGYTEK